MSVLGQRWPRRNLVVPSSIDDLTDVTVTSPATNQILIWNGSAWVNSTQRLPFPTTGDADKVVAVKATEDGYELVAAGGGGGAPDDPIANPFVLFTADAGLSGLSDGDPVSTWEDQSANGYDLTQSGSARPTYKAQDTSDGLPYVAFDGSDDVLVHNGFSTLTASGFTIFLVLRYTIQGSQSFSGIMSLNSGSNNDYDRAGSLGVSTYNEYLVAERNNLLQSAPRATLGGTGSTQEPRAFAVFCLRYGTDPLGQDTFSIWRNGLAAHYAHTTAALDATILSLGGRYSGGGTGWQIKSHVRHLSIYSSRLTDAQVRDMMAHLAFKWKVPTVL